ncbi:MAG: type II toxin-antitoxin system RelE/ParE family toxin [Sideroxyarcus sp.]|nr:type II toxin-antitoxin system RelE/ParE family toxin [Sideroxyarcus sp.]
MSRIRFTNSAETDLLELWLTIAEENLVAADESLDAIQATASLLGTQPEMGRARPELADKLRSFPTRTPYIIFYLPEADGLLVVRVLHHARDIDADYFS